MCIQDHGLYGSTSWCSL